PRHHADIGAELGVLDSTRAAKLSGARFSVAAGPGARLERALAAFFLDLHTSEHGYTEYSVPHLVTRETMTATGQLPKFEEELFRICEPEKAQEELELMVGQATECLERLGLSYRVMLLPAVDMGFSARMTYDIEVWMPGSGAFREVSSVSDCGTFQARRAG